MAYTAQQFLEIIKPMVIADMKNSGILASLTASQALIESNKGNSGLTQKANNLFGIKGEYNGQSVTMPTAEYYNGVKTTVNAAFRKYPSWQESISDHSAMFNRMKRYSNLRGLTDYKLACQRVKEDGYATSPSYTSTLIKTVETYKLYEWDEEVLGVNVDVVQSVSKLLPTVKKGARGEYVLIIQNAVGAAADGIFGPKTEAAVKTFQALHGLVIDGIVGPKTWAAING